MTEENTSSGSVVDDRFVLLRRLGQGGGATVWLAQDTRTQTEVALKLVHAHLRKQIRALERFAREATVLLEFDHPNIARCHAFRMDTVAPYIAMDFVAGHSLKEELGRRAPTDRHFTTDLLIRLFTELTSAVDYAHSKNVLHRDLSAANVLLDTTGDEVSARVVDFGVAKLMDADRSHATTLGRIIGTPASLAPEMAAGEEIDHRADQYSLGVLLFEMLTLRRAWVLDGQGGHQHAYDGPIPQIIENRPLGLFRRICTAARPDVREVRPELPSAIAEVVKRALAADAEERFTSVAELGEATRDALDGVVLAEVDATYVVERGRRRGSTIAPPGEAQDTTGVVPRRASSLIVASEDVSGESVLDPATLPTAENAVPDVPRAAQVNTQTIEVVDPTAAPTDAVAVVSRSDVPAPIVGVTQELEVEAPAPTPVIVPQEEPPLDPTPLDGRAPLGQASVAFDGASPDTTAVFDDRTRTAVRSSPSRAAPIVAAVVGIAVALVVIAVFGVPFSERTPQASAVPGATAAPSVQVTAKSVEEAPPPIEPARSTKRRRRRARETPVAPRTPPPPPPVEEAPKPASGRLRSMLARVKSSPSDADALEALADGLVGAAKRLSDERARDRIIRMVETSRVMADVAGLERALRALERASS
ncbi:MAG: protein kinase [Deltaproteobacteria bacterium]|jgi:tRNA A-37 threonylcarbamoyl transferase component Bud32